MQCEARRSRHRGQCKKQAKVWVKFHYYGGNTITRVHPFCRQHAPIIIAKFNAGDYPDEKSFAKVLRDIPTNI